MENRKSSAGARSGHSGGGLARRHARWVPVAGAVGTAVATLCAEGCSDSAGAMTDYLNASKVQRDTYKVADASFDAPTNSASFSGTYIASCLAPFVQGNLTDLLVFKALIQYAAQDPKNGTLTMTLQALPAGVFKANAAIGPIFPADPNARRAQVVNGQFTFNFGTILGLPAEANSILHEAWGISDLKMAGFLTDAPRQACAVLGGKALPAGLPADGTQCILQLVPDDTTSPAALTAADYKCP